MVTVTDNVAAGTIGLGGLQVNIHIYINVLCVKLLMYMTLSIPCFDYCLILLTLVICSSSRCVDVCYMCVRVVQESKGRVNR